MPPRIQGILKALVLGIIACDFAPGVYAIGKVDSPTAPDIKKWRRIYWIPTFIPGILLAVFAPSFGAGVGILGIVAFAASINAIFRTHYFVIPFTKGKTLGPF